MTTDNMTTDRTPLASVTAFIKRRPVLTYYVLTFAISWGGILLVMAIGGSGIMATGEEVARLLPYAIPALLGGPSIAGLLMIGVVSGRAGYRDLWSRMRHWRVGAGWYAIAILAAPLVLLGIPLALSLISPVFFPTFFTASDKASLLMFGIVWGLVVGLLEELGWTGFATPQLRLRYSVLATGLIVGVLWGAWHILSNDVWGAASLAGEIPVALFLIVNGVSFLVGQLVAFRVLMVWVYDRTGSLLIVMLMHASLTACSMIFGAATTGMAFLIGSFVTSVVWWLIVAAVVIAGATAQGGQYWRQPLRSGMA